MYWRMMIICIWLDLSRVIRQLTLKIAFYFMHLFTKGHSLTSKFALFFSERTSGWIIYASLFLSRIFRNSTLNIATAFIQTGNLPTSLLLCSFQERQDNILLSIRSRLLFFMKTVKIFLDQSYTLIPMENRYMYKEHSYRVWP
jgi:hypothetical protein